MQNGGGFTFKIANINAAAVSDRSPPDSSASPCCFLPGGRAMTLHAGRRDVLRIGQHQLGRSAREQFLEHALEFFGDLLERLAERRLHQLIEFDDDLIQLLDRLFQVRRLLRQEFKALLGFFVFDSALRD